MTALYDRIGRQYCTTRSADPRITDLLLELLALPAGSLLCDVGAGSGNYTNALANCGYRLHAVEPSKVMRQQAIAHPGVTWMEGNAEHLPLPNDSVHGVICTLAAHHFKSLPSVAHEMQRVCPRGSFVFFTMDPRSRTRTWFEDYFPEIGDADLAAFPALDEFVGTIGTATGRIGEIQDFLLPADLIDNFMYAPWNRPEVYLDAKFRENTSGFAKADQKIIAYRLAVLAKDLKSGAWDVRHGELRTRPTFDAGFRFVTFRES